MQHDHLWLLAWEQTYLFIFILCKIPSRQLVEHTIKPHYRFWPLLSNTKNNTLFSQASLWKQSIANTLFPQASLRKQSIRQLTPLNDNLKKYIKPKMPYFLVEGYHFHSAVLLHSHKFQCASDSHKFQCASEQLSRSIVKLMSDFIFHKMTTPWCWFHRLVFLDLVDWQSERNYVFFMPYPGCSSPAWPVQVKSVLNREETKTHIIVSRQQTKCFMQ